jgi:DNA polymerase-3 subunit delta
MKPKEFTTAIDRGEIRPLYYLYGDEPYLMEVAVRRLVERLVTPDMRDFNLNVFYGTECRGGEIAEAAATLPMFAPWRVVLVKKADALPAAALELLLSYLQSPSPSTCLAFLGEKIDQRKKFFTEFRKHGELVEFKRPYENQLPAFIRNEASARGKGIEPAAAEMLVYLVGNNLQELVSELEKAVLYVGGRDRIAVADIRAVVSDTRVNSVFELADSLGDKNIDRALRSLETLLRGGEAPLLVLAMITRHYRQLWKVRELLDRKTPQPEIGKATGIAPYFLQGVIRQAGNYHVRELKGIFARLFEIDLAMKSGRGRPDVLLETFVMEVCGRGG